MGNVRTATIGELVQRIQVEREDRPVRLVQATRVVGARRRALRVHTLVRVPVECTERRPDRLALSSDEDIFLFTCTYGIDFLVGGIQFGSYKFNKLRKAHSKRFSTRCLVSPTTLSE